MYTVRDVSKEIAYIQSGIIFDKIHFMAWHNPISRGGIIKFRYLRLSSDYKCVKQHFTDEY